MKEEIISFETAKLAKEKGFNGETIYYYDFMGDKCSGLITNWNNSSGPIYTAPTLSLLQKWLRERPTPIIVTPETDFVAWHVWVENPDLEGIYIDKINERWIDSYEAALEVGLQEALKLI